MKMVEKRPLTDDELETLFGAAQSHAAEPSASVMARIMGDALAVSQESAVAAPARPTKNVGLFERLIETIGGWPAAAGLATAAMVGVMIGVVTPDTLENLSGGFLSAESGLGVEDFAPSLSSFLEEG